MGAGEYVSVSTQRDSEQALLEKERRELDEEPEERAGRARRHLRAQGAQPRSSRTQVASELTEHDALRAHAEVELGIDPDDLTNPWHAAWASMARVHGRRAAAAAHDHARGRPATGCSVDRRRGRARAGGHRLGQRPARLRPRRRKAVLRNVGGGLFAMGVTYAHRSAGRHPASAECQDPCACSWRWCRPTEAVEHLDDFLERAPCCRAVPLGRRRAAAPDAGLPRRGARPAALDDLVERLGRAAARRTPFQTRGDRRRRLPERRPRPGPLGGARPRRRPGAPS